MGTKGVGLRKRSSQEALLWPDELERLFDRARRGVGVWPWRRIWQHRPFLWLDEKWTPDIDMFERQGKIVVQADLPGMKQEDIDIFLEGAMLVIHGRRQEEKEIKEDDYYCSERAVGEFSRAISLPEGVKIDAIEATYKNGVLKIEMPRVEAQETQKIKVEIK